MESARQAILPTCCCIKEVLVEKMVPLVEFNSRDSSGALASFKKIMRQRIIFLGIKLFLLLPQLCSFAQSGTTDEALIWKTLNHYIVHRSLKYPSEFQEPFPLGVQCYAWRSILLSERLFAQPLAPSMPVDHFFSGPILPSGPGTDHAAGHARPAAGKFS